jgi:hypothetical protein
MLTKLHNWAKRVDLLFWLALAGLVAVGVSLSSGCSEESERLLPATDGGHVDAGCYSDEECADGLFCTSSGCTEGGCFYEVAPYFCAIGGVCVPEGKEEPDNFCARCLPDIDPLLWSDAGLDGWSGQGFTCVGGVEVPL